MTPVELLREAARLMRERATAATPSADPLPGGWKGFGTVGGSGSNWSELYGGPAEDGYRTGTVFSTDEHCNACNGPSDADVQHIAGWHPAVALAVADSLDYAARTLGYLDARGHRPAANGWVSSCITIARTYLGVES